MNLHEYQAKRLFADYGLPVSVGYAADTSDEAVAAAERIGGKAWVCKVQVHAGGRGKAGGVQLVDSIEEVRSFAERWLGGRLVTVQTDAEGQPVNQVYIEACAGIERELYLGAVIDRSSSRIVVMASKEGCGEIEKVAEESPEKIFVNDELESNPSKADITIELLYPLPNTTTSDGSIKGLSPWTD